MEPGHRLPGTLDAGLNVASIEQGWRMAKRLRNLSVLVVYTSPLRRARHTALIVSRNRKWPVVLEPELRKIDHGTGTGMTLHKIAGFHPDEFAAWQMSPGTLQLDGGEPLQKAYRRAAGFFAEDDEGHLRWRYFDRGPWSH